MLSVPEKENDGNNFRTLETKAWESAFCHSLAIAHNPKEGSLGWRHQILLGTLFSYVVQGDIANLSSSLESIKNRSNFLQIINDQDENGDSALHLACYRRDVEAIKLLVAFRADVSCKTSNDDSPLHLCARRLDHQSISVLLSSQIRPDPCALNKAMLTPMATACIEGLNVCGHRDPALLQPTLEKLSAKRGSMIKEEDCDADQSLDTDRPLHPVHRMALDWNPELFLVMGYSRFYVADGTISLNGKYDYPMHACIVALLKLKNAKTDDILLKATNGFLSTMQVLIKYGCEPNERCDGGCSFVESNGFVGYTPMDVLAKCALELKKNKEKIRGFGVISKLIADMAELLVRNGARFNLNRPPKKRQLSFNRQSSDSSVASSFDINHQEKKAVPFTMEQRMKIEGNEALLNILGTSDRLNNALSQWSSLEPVGDKGLFLRQSSTTTSRKDAIKKKHSSFLESSTASRKDALKKKPSSFLEGFDLDACSSARGGSDEKSCSICWKVFGLVSSRRQTCQASMRYVIYIAMMMDNFPY